MKDIIGNLNNIVDSQGIEILADTKSFLTAMSFVMTPEKSKECGLIFDSVENNILDLLKAAIVNEIEYDVFSEILSSFIDKTMNTCDEADKEFVLQVFLGVYSHCVKKEIDEIETIDSKTQSVSNFISCAARVQRIMDKISAFFKHIKKSIKKETIIAVIFLVMEILLIVYLLNSDVVFWSINESLGTYLILQIVAIIHVFLGVIFGNISKQKWMTYISSAISVILAVFCFIYAMGALEGIMIKVLGFFFFGAIAYGVTMLCVKLPEWIGKIS